MPKELEKVMFVVAEAVPFAKAGGVADVAGALPSVLKKRGLDVRVFLPMHGTIEKGKYNLHRVVTGLIEKVGRTQYSFDVYETESYEGVKVYLLHNHKLFGSRKKIYGYDDDNVRYYLFDRIALRFLQSIDWKPNVIHCNDWQTGLIPYFINFDDDFSDLNGLATLYTIHNLSYQYHVVHEYYLRYGLDDGIGLIEPNLADVRRTNFAKRGILNADKLNAVSPQYAEEILTEELGMGLEKYLHARQRDLSGILNGVDYFLFNPQTDEYLQTHFDENSLDKKLENKELLQHEFKLPVDSDVPLFGIVSRLAGHKGFDLVSKVVNVLLKMPVQMVVTGTGEKRYVKLFEGLAKKYPKKIATHLEMNLEVASKIYAASDMFLMPSKFEPCGLGQLIALRYGSIPIVHNIGGLSDTIKDFDVVTREGNGFVFDNYNELSFYGAIVRALEHFKNKEVWIPLVRKVMQERFSWDDSVDKYIGLYASACRKRKKLVK